MTDNDNMEDSQFEGMMTDLRAIWTLPGPLDWDAMCVVIEQAGFTFPLEPETDQDGE